MKIVVDAMGGDHAPEVVVAGAVAEARERGTQIILVGQEARVHAELAKHGDVSKLPIEIVHASEVVEMAEHTLAVKAKRDSSLAVGIRLVKEGKADAFASAGNSGAVMAAALFGLGRIPGVERPADRQHLSGRTHAVPDRRHRRERRLQAGIPGAVCDHGPRLRPRHLRHRTADCRHRLQRGGRG